MAATGDTGALAAQLRVAIEVEFGAAAQPIDAVLVELEERAEGIDGVQGGERTRELSLLEPLLDQIEDLLDLLRVGG
jgi:hypothetical protein